MTDTPFTVRRLTEVSDELAAAMAPLFDVGVVWDREEGRAFLADPATVFLLAEVEGVPAGFLYGYRLPRFDRSGAGAELYEVGVDERYQRRGIGRALVSAFNAWARSVGAAESWVLTETDNDAARALYRATGGSEDEDEIVSYTWDLTQPRAPTQDD
jgi:ribosomal protein S18 acetylase RimI-like enzyme